jgi:hypothetical protein
MGERRIARLMIPGDPSGSVIVDGTGQLPSIEFELAADEMTVAALGRALGEVLGIVEPIVDCLIDQSEQTDPGAPVAVLVELARRATVERQPDGWTSVPADACSLSVEPALKERLHDWVAERSGRAVPDPRRPDWARPGWYAAASEWIDRSLTERGLPRPTAVLQFRHWGISAVMRVETPARRYWFKAVFEHFRREAAVTQFLDRHLPGFVAGVVAIDADRGWLLLEDLGTGSMVADAADHRRAFAHLARAQRALATRRSELLAAGCELRPLHALPDDFARAVADTELRPWLDVPSSRVRQLVTWLEGAVERVEALRMPDVLVHGDFHPGNVASDGERRIVFDWSDAAISKPFVDVVTWRWWLIGDPEAIEALWRSFLDEWSATHPVGDWEARRTDLEGLAGAYHVVSYAGIVAGLERRRRQEHANGLAVFFDLLESSVPT